MVAWGHSLICDPWGTVLHECGSGEEVAVTDLDLSRVDAVRQQLPILSARPDGYIQISAGGRSAIDFSVARWRNFLKYSLTKVSFYDTIRFVDARAVLAAPDHFLRRRRCLDRKKGYQL